MNAVIVTRIDEARAHAAVLDAEAAAGSFRPLHGLPMTIKEAFDWADTPSTWGNVAWRDNVPGTDAVTVQRLLDAGAVIYGKTNVPFMLGDWQSFNDIYGTTNNPWDISRVPGGSSGFCRCARHRHGSPRTRQRHWGINSKSCPLLRCIWHKPTMSLVPFEGLVVPGMLPESTSASVALSLGRQPISISHCLCLRVRLE